MNYARRATAEGGVVQDTSAREVVTYFAATTRSKVTYGTADGISTGRTLSFG